MKVYNGAIALYAGRLADHRTGARAEEFLAQRGPFLRHRDGRRAAPAGSSPNGSSTGRADIDMIGRRPAPCSAPYATDRIS